MISLDCRINSRLSAQNTPLYPEYLVIKWTNSEHKAYFYTLSTNTLINFYRVVLSRNMTKFATKRTRIVDDCPLVVGNGE